MTVGGACKHICGPVVASVHTDFQGWRRILNLLAQPPLHQHSVYRYVYCGHITSQDASGELFFATSSFASARAELFRPIRNAQAVQNYRQFNFLSNTPFKHYYCIATALIVSPSKQAVQAGRPSTTIAERSTTPCRFYIKQAVQHYFLRRHCLSCLGRGLRQHWRLFRLDTEAAQHL